MRRASVVLLLAVAVAGSARADVSPPFPWRPAPAPESSHVEALRASLEAWMDDGEKARLAARRHPRCGVVYGRNPRAAGYGRPCPDGDRVRHVAIDRGVRFFAAAVLEARGRREEAAALRDLAPMREAAARAEAARRLGDDAELAAARRLALHGPGWSLEQIATELGRIIRAAVEAGAPREAMVAAALVALGELSHPGPRSRVRAEVPPERSASDRRFAQLVAHHAQGCLRPEVEARWRPVAVRLAVIGGAERAEVTAAAPPALAACLASAAQAAAASRREPPPARPLAMRVVFGPEASLWGAPHDLGPQD